MKLNKIILGLLCICNFSYAKTWNEVKEESLSRINDIVKKVGKEGLINYKWPYYSTYTGKRALSEDNYGKDMYKVHTGELSFEKFFAERNCSIDYLKWTCYNEESTNLENLLISNPNADMFSNKTFNNIVFEDPYNNKGKFYLLEGDVLQRLDENSMLVQGGDIWEYSKKTIVYVEGIPKGVSIIEDKRVNIMVKGDGVYKYINGFGEQKIVSKVIWQDYSNTIKKDESNTIKKDESNTIKKDESNTIIKKQYNENGILLEIEYPSKIIPKTKVDFKITVTNNLPYINTKGGVSISFPQFKNLDVINNNSTLSITNYPYQSKLWNVNINKSISSKYFMIEGWENDWKQSQRKNMTFSVYIDDDSELTNIHIFVRTILKSNNIEYVNPINGIEGQQGYKNINISIPLIKD